LICSTSRVLDSVWPLLCSKPSNLKAQIWMSMVTQDLR
jgi:hypothetical protein